MADTFYQPLQGPRSVRLLKLGILPTHISPEHPRLCCLLQTFELDSSPDYLALSYTWGKAVRESVDENEEEAPGSSQPLLPFVLTRLLDDEILDSVPDDGDEQPKQVSICGATFLITQNLQDALIQLFLSDYYDRWFWIDALCINQTDAGEKGVQVALMGDIYSNAKEVIVWLGADETDLGDFMWLNTEFLGALDSYNTEHGFENLRRQSPYDHKLLSSLNVTPPGGDWLQCWANYFNFCRRRRWFTRIWVTQEVTLAKKVLIMCGKSVISWDSIELLGTLLDQLGWQIALAPNASIKYERTPGDEIIRISSIRKQLRSRLLGTCDDGGPRPLQKLSPTPGSSSGVSAGDSDSWYQYFQLLLFQTRTYSAGDPRDKIFAILGIANETLPLGMKLPLTPDYSGSSSVESLYTSTASLFLQNLPRLSYLSFVEDRMIRRLRHLPSWVPDHTVAVTSSPLILIRGASFQFDACPASILPSLCCLPKDILLELKGGKFDRVVEVYPPMWDITKSSTIESCLQACEELGPFYPSTNEDPGEVLWRTLIANTSSGEPAPLSMLPAFKIWVRNRVATTLTPEILEIDEAGVMTKNVTLNMSKIENQLETLKRLHKRYDGRLSLPTGEEVLGTVRLLHRFKMQDFVAQRAILDPGDPFPTPIEQMDRIETGAVQIQKALGHTLPYRRLYRTEKGYLGLGPASMEVGDEVWLLQGAMVPFVFRSLDGGTCSLIGESYLHGCMDGKMAEELKHEMARISIF